MLRSHSFFIIASITLLGAPILRGQTKSDASSNRIQLKLNSDEAEAMLAILDKRKVDPTPRESDWQRLFSSEPYIRLQKREAAMHRDFTDDDFKKFVLSPELAAKAPDLRKTLNGWEHADLAASARRALAYLPDSAVIHAKVFPEIKPKTNSFVFDTTTDPAIFLYLDPEESAAKFENTVAHELHHIGFSNISSLTAERQKDLPPNVKPAVEWMSAFGEGFAMLAAAGGPDVDPHAASPPAEHARWDHDLANFNEDVGTLQQFFLDIVNGKLATKDAINEKASTFFGDAQGPWYTVGYKMAVLVEKRFGRQVLIDCMLDPRELLLRYNQVAQLINEQGKEHLALWSPELMGKISVRQADIK